MSCHYSCLTCSSSVYQNLCISCPTNRYLVDTQCFCASGFYQDQTSQCASSLSTDNITLYGLSVGLYYWMIFMFWLSVLFTLNHIYSPKAKIFIQFGQLIGLISQYRYRFSYISQKYLDVFETLNFSYFNNLFCTQKSKPYDCLPYQNISGPVLMIIAFLLIYVISYLITRGCVMSVLNGEGTNQIIIRAKSKKNIKEGYSLSLLQYFQMSFSSFFLVFLDYCVVSLTAQIFKIIKTSYLTWLILIPVAIFLVMYLLFHLRKVNSQKQFNVGYRSQYGYFYLYDENYHLFYIDYLFQEQKQSKQGQLYVPSRFYPSSNFMIMQIGVKFLIAATTILAFQFKPQLIVYPIGLFLLLMLYYNGIFQIYQSMCLLIYFACSVFYLVAVSVFHLDRSFYYFIIGTAIFFSFLISLFVIISLSAWNRSKQGKYLQKAFQSLASNQETGQIQKPQELNIDIQPLSMEDSQEDLAPNKTNLTKFNAMNTLYTKKSSAKQLGLSKNQTNRQSQNQLSKQTQNQISKQTQNQINKQTQNKLHSISNIFQEASINRQTNKISFNKLGLNDTVNSIKKGTGKSQNKDQSDKHNTVHNKEQDLQMQNKQKQSYYQKLSRRKFQKQQDLFILQEQEQMQNSAQQSQKPLSIKQYQKASQKSKGRRIQQNKSRESKLQDEKKNMKGQNYEVKSRRGNVLDGSHYSKKSKTQDKVSQLQRQNQDQKSNKQF